MIPTVLVMIGVPFMQRTIVNDEPFEGDRLRCAIAIDGKSREMSYPIGYNYEMLKLFAWQMDKESEILIGGSEYLDSLEEGSFDIVVYPYDDSLFSSSAYMPSIPLADSSAWIINSGQESEHKVINLWLSRFFITESHSRIVERFRPSYEPYRRAKGNWKYSTLSPYDELIRRYSSELGWNKEMLTAIIWQESMFRIESHSRRGAVGLMQLMPKTADRFEAENLLDPEDNISSGIKYLKYLQGMFRKYASDKDELVKFTLAAYNAGEGRLLDCINYAASIGSPNDKWSDLVAVIPDMREDSILDVDTVKLGKFKGHETINYVDKVYSLYDTFCLISSDRK